MEADPGSRSCFFSSPSSSPTRHPQLRSVKRKLDAMDAPRGRRDDHHHNHHHQQQQLAVDVLAKVEVENECGMLRETLAAQQLTIQDLYVELDEERNASSSAANEAMSMILRLQREKAEIQMDARQFKSFAEERMAHDQHQILLLEDAVYSLELAIDALTLELEAYRKRLIGLGVPPSPPPLLPLHRDGDGIVEYPSLKCHVPPPDDDFHPQRSPGSRGQSVEGMENADEGRSCLLEELEKGVVMGNSPNRHSREFSAESSTSFVNSEVVQECAAGSDGQLRQDYPDMVVVDDRDSDDEDVYEKVCTIDSVHERNGDSGAIRKDYANDHDPDIKKLYTRLQALEADRDSLRQTLASIKTESKQDAQLVLLREIAQNLSKGVQHESERTIVHKRSLFGLLPFVWIFKSLVPFLFWERKQNCSKYSFGVPNNVTGLMLLLDNSQHFQRLRCLTRLRR